MTKIPKDFLSQGCIYFKAFGFYYKTNTYQKMQNIEIHKIQIRCLPASQFDMHP